MQTIDLNVSLRDSVGKGFSRRTRAKKAVPGVFYGPHLAKPLALSIDGLVLAKARKTATSNSIYKLLDNNSTQLHGRLALLKELQVHPVTEASIHVDLYEVREGEALSLKVPVKVLGKALGVSLDGGILQTLLRELRVRCLPKDIPASIEVDVTELRMGQSLHVSDLNLPKGVEAPGQGSYAIVTIAHPEKEEKAQVAAGTPEVGSAAAPAQAPAAEATPAK